jgi:hypothetical protein
MPVGVWNVRENVRHALQQKPLKFVTFNEVLNHIDSKLHIDLNIWINNSKMLSNTLKQRKISDYFK